MIPVGPVYASPRRSWARGSSPTPSGCTARTGAAADAMTLFRHSITYLGLLFAAVAVDTVVRFGA